MPEPAEPGSQRETTSKRSTGLAYIVDGSGFVLKLATPGRAVEEKMAEIAAEDGVPSPLHLSEDLHGG